MHRTLFVPLRPGEGAQASWNTVSAARSGLASDPWDGRPDRSGRFAELLRRRFPAATLHDLAPHLDAMRLVKSPAEVELMRRAGRLAALGVVEAMRATRPGAYEYQLEAACRFAYLDHGAMDVSYRAVAAGGANAWYYHYLANDAPLRDGDLVLFDCGPDLAYYASDVTRMWPVNGAYSPERRQLYGFVLAYHAAIIERLGPGVTAEQVLAEAEERMARVVAETAWLKPAYEAAARAALGSGEHLSHPVGMAVHDVGEYKGAPLAPGIVLSVDPQLRVPEERLYVRVEDTVAITDEGCEVLTADAPYDMDEVEALLRGAPDSPFAAYRRLWA